uniref:NADH-ubiquinone oxidoreductase chain 6 n=1 Tax=Sphenodon punctatus TaxID=8508 RepID=A0A0F7LDM0_SPHPU|nr:NADH dehydrogenase subunit 6 [Sphenodon punctatus]
MTYAIFLFGLCFVFGLLLVASNPSPYYGVLGLLMASAVGGGFLVGVGSSFLSVILFLIYSGGMLVVFAYSVALAADFYPEAWGSRSVAVNPVVFLSLLVFVGSGFSWGLSKKGVGEETVDFGGISLIRGDFGGVAILYDFGCSVLVVSGWVLLVALFVVLELTRGQSRGSLRAV